VVSLPPRAPEWGEEEVVALLYAVRKHGTNWKLILEDPEFSGQFHSARTRMSLKTKWFKMKNVQGFDFATHDISEFARVVSTVHGYSVKKSNIVIAAPAPDSLQLLPPPAETSRKRKVSFTDIDSTSSTSSADRTSQVKQITTPEFPQQPIVSKPIQISSAPSERKYSSKSPGKGSNKEGSKKSQVKASPKVIVKEGRKEEESRSEVKPVVCRPKVRKEEAKLSAPVSKPPARKKRRVLSFNNVEKIVGHKFVGVSANSFNFSSFLISFHF
jgi:hypothetical protein